MLTPEDLQAIANDLTDIYSDVERECISSIVHRLVSSKGVTQSSVWRMKKLADVGALKRELVQKVSQESRVALPKVGELIERAMSRSVGLDLDKARKALKEAGGLTRDELFSSIVEGREFQRILKSATVACRKAMNLTGTKAVQASVASYTRAIDNAYLKMASGNYDMARCVRDAVSEIGSSGLRIVEGKTPKGSSLYRRDGELRTTYSSRRSYPLDAAIRRDLTTQMNRSCAELALADCDKVGTRLVQTSWHVGARPEHERWQGKVFSLDRDGKHPYFYDSQDAGGTGYGDLLGLCGINCYHSFGPYFEGDPIPSEGKPTAEENEKAYREQQTQRSFERSLRALKRQQTALREGGFKDDAGYVQSRINEVNARYRAFLSETGRKRVSMLDQTSGYHPVKALSAEDLKYKGIDSMGVRSGDRYARERFYAENRSRLKVEEVKTIREYTDTSYKAMNSRLRHPTETVSNAEDVDRLNATLRNALRKTMIDENIRAYRSAGSIEGFSKRMGIPLEDLMDNQTNIGLKGIRFKDEAFLSTSIFPDHTLYNKTVMMDVLIPRGTHGMYIQPISKYPKQYELLLQAGTRFTIQDARYKDGILHLVVIAKV